jgi:hypothetical protein
VTQALNVVVLESKQRQRDRVLGRSAADRLGMGRPASDRARGMVFGWSGGKQLIKQSYTAAEVKEHELKEEREERRAAHARRWRINR